jgi:hypothetical protein
MNQDQVVDVTDLLMLIDDWGSTNGPGDFDGNGTTDISDLLILISAWGDCTL